jgi:hypothetical protein
MMVECEGMGGRFSMIKQGQRTIAQHDVDEEFIVKNAVQVNSQKAIPAKELTSAKEKRQVTKKNQS